LHKKGRAKRRPKRAQDSKSKRRFPKKGKERRKETEGSQKGGPTKTDEHGLDAAKRRTPNENIARAKRCARVKGT